MDLHEFVAVQGLRYCIVKDAEAISSLLEQLELWNRRQSIKPSELRSIKNELIQRIAKIRYSIDNIEKFVYQS